jgi:flagellar basal-body rod protein FlgF
MINGLYTAASGMNAEMVRQDVIANNLANVSTIGYKKDEAVFTDFPNVLVHRINDRMQTNTPPMLINQAAPLLGKVGHGNQVDGVVVNFSDSSYSQTDRKLDLAVKGSALFTLELADGSRAFTRAGNFTINEKNELCTPAGDLVMSKGGKSIQVDGEVVVDSSGAVFVDGQHTEDLLFTPINEANHFIKRGENLFLRVEEDLAVEEPVEEAKVEVMQGYLEQPNVKVIEEMVDMISVMRAYEANQKSIQMQDETLSKAINEVGRPA